MKRPNLTPERVLLCRLSAIGDCILTIPLAVRIKELWPNCKLTWVVDCPAAQLLQPHPAVDEVMKIERHWVKNSRLWTSLREVLRARKFDVSLDPQGLIKSGLIAWLSGAKLRLGFDYSQARELAPLLATRRIRRTARHMADTYLELLTPWATFHCGNAKFNMPVYTAAVEKLPEILTQSKLDRNEEYICVAPGAGWTTKLWPVERYAQVAEYMLANHQIRTLVVWAGDNEKLMAQAIAEKSGGAAVVAPRTSLTELAEVARRSSLFLAGDTGPLHLAAAMKTPCVGLFGPTWADEVGPYGSGHIAVQSPQLPSGRSMRLGNNNAMQAIEVEEVIGACVKALIQSRDRQAA
jgi:heptosyltransferase I